MVPPFDHPWIIAGQGTAGLEIVDQCAELAAVYVPIGGGGLIAGVAAAVKRLKAHVRVIGVEPVGAAKMKASVEAGHPVTLEKTGSIADGLLPVRPGDLTFAHVQAFVDEIVTVDDDEIASAVVWLFQHAKLVVEPSGAASVAAVRKAGGRPAPGGIAVAVLSGGNIALETLVGLAATAARP
jgi:threonine dehydratase